MPLRERYFERSYSLVTVCRIKRLAWQRGDKLKHCEARLACCCFACLKDLPADAQSRPVWMNIECSHPGRVRFRVKQFVDASRLRLISAEKCLPFAPSAAANYLILDLCHKVGRV